jgi:hypothetical protein
MQSSGAGLTFTDHDVKMVRVVIGLLSRATFKELDAGSVSEASNAFRWIEELAKLVKDNVLDYSTARMIEAPKGKAKK